MLKIPAALFPSNRTQQWPWWTLQQGSSRGMDTLAYSGGPVLGRGAFNSGGPELLDTALLSKFPPPHLALCYPAPNTLTENLTGNSEALPYQYTAHFVGINCVGDNSNVKPKGLQGGEKLLPLLPHALWHQRLTFTHLRQISYHRLHSASFSSCLLRLNTYIKWLLQLSLILWLLWGLLTIIFGGKKNILNPRISSICGKNVKLEFFLAIIPYFYPRN